MDNNSKYIAKRAIFAALLKGRHLSQMDCREFEVEDMRTPISHMKDQITLAGYTLHSKNIKTPKGRTIKEYWAIPFNTLDITEV